VVGCPGAGTRTVHHFTTPELIMETYFQNMAVEEGSKDKLIRDLNTLVHDAEALIKIAGKDLSAKSKEQLMAALERFKITCHRVEAEAVSAAKATDKIIREHPYKSIGVAFGVGVLLGVLVSRD
jgi:ElaB/YqjD/DUF883 family membrane-anchored ribosome-binding protein